jgi:hypothetical protein
VYQHTKGSLVLPILIHWIFNTDFLPRGTSPVLTALLTLAALVVVGLTKFEPWRARGSAEAENQAARSQNPPA